MLGPKPERKLRLQITVSKTGLSLIDTLFERAIQLLYDEWEATNDREFKEDARNLKNFWNHLKKSAR